MQTRDSVRLQVFEDPQGRLTKFSSESHQYNLKVSSLRGFDRRQILKEMIDAEY